MEIIEETELVIADRMTDMILNYLINNELPELSEPEIELLKRFEMLSL